MFKKLILLIILSVFANASTLKTNDKISTFSLPNQFDKIHTVSSEISTIIVTSKKESANLVNEFLSSKNCDFLDLHKAIFINDISRVPSVAVKMFELPQMRDYKYEILLIYKEHSKKFIEKENKITVYLLKDGFVKDIKFISSIDELEEIFK